MHLSCQLGTHGQHLRFGTYKLTRAKPLVAWYGGMVGIAQLVASGSSDLAERPACFPSRWCIDCLPLPRFCIPLPRICCLCIPLPRLAFTLWPDIIMNFLRVMWLVSGLATVLFFVTLFLFRCRLVENSTLNSEFLNK